MIPPQTVANRALAAVPGEKQIIPLRVLRSVIRSFGYHGGKIDRTFRKSCSYLPMTLLSMEELSLERLFPIEHLPQRHTNFLESLDAGETVCHDRDRVPKTKTTLLYYL